MSPAPAPALSPIQRLREDPLSYLPCSEVREYKNGEAVYQYGEERESLYLILSGTIRVTRMVSTGDELMLDLYRTDDFFGEAGVLNLCDKREQAIAVQKASVMVWPRTRLEELIVSRPKLGIALLQVFGQRAFDFTGRMASLAFNPIDVRLAECLLRFSEHLGTAQEDGSLTMDPLTHGQLAQYVGTSRELISTGMAKFRRDGYIKYSRRAITVYGDALKAWLRERPSIAPQL